MPRPKRRADLELGRAHGHGALHLDDDERGRERGRDAQPLRENTQRHASARQSHHTSQLTRPGGSCLPAASAPSPYVVPIAAISRNLAAAPPPAPDESGQSTQTRIHSCTKLKLEQFKCELHSRNSYLLGDSDGTYCDFRLLWPGRRAGKSDTLFTFLFLSDFS